MLLVFGWFHLQMAFAQSLHKQYLGTVKSQGLWKSFNVMKRKGLLTTSIWGPFHHHLDEALKHVFRLTSVLLPTLIPSASFGISHQMSC